MKLILATVGRLKPGPERELYERYAKRIGATGKSAAIGPLTTIEVPESRKARATDRRAEEAAQLLARVGEEASLVVLDESGDGMSSKQFAGLIGTTRDAGATALAFAIGGPDGHGDEIRDRAVRVLSLGQMTLAHGLARVVLGEQIYRAVTILTGHPYHRG